MGRVASLVLAAGLVGFVVSYEQEMPPAAGCADARPTPTSAVSVPLPQALVTGDYKFAEEPDLSIAYLVDQYHVSRAEARRQLMLQLESADLWVWLRQRYPDEVGQMRLEHEPPGTVVVPTTDPATLARDPELNRYANRSSLVIERVAWSRRTVEAITDCLRSQLGEPAREIQSGLDVDPAAGRIWIEAADTAAGRAYLASAPVTAAVSAGAGVIAVRTHPWVDLEEKGG